MNSLSCGILTLLKPCSRAAEDYNLEEAQQAAAKLTHKSAAGKGTSKNPATFVSTKHVMDGHATFVSGIFFGFELQMPCSFSMTSSHTSGALSVVLVFYNGSKLC